MSTSNTGVLNESRSGPTYASSAVSVEGNLRRTPLIRATIFRDAVAVAFTNGASGPCGAPYPATV